MTTTRPLAAALCLLFLAALPVAADTELSGTTPGGAHYRIEAPDDWAPGDGLVIWNHGFSLSPIGPTDDVGPLADIHKTQGYAVAASTYRDSGWALFKSAQDIEQLIQRVERDLGVPGDIFVYGASLGGIVTANFIETTRRSEVKGALPFCGAVAGSRNWDGALDFRLFLDAVCDGMPGYDLPGAEKGLPKTTDLTPDDVEAAVNACTGVDLPPGARTAAQKKNLRKLKKVSKIPTSFFQTVSWYVTFGLADLSWDRKKMRGKSALENADVDYRDAKVNQSIARVEAKPKPQRRLERNYTPTGDVGDIKIVSLHTDKDGLVIVENETEYAKVVPPENLTVAVVRERVPTHCGFSPSELVAAWETLREWAAGGPQPGAADIQSLCGDFEPVLGGPCRIDPGFKLRDMDRRVRPRDGG